MKVIKKIILSIIRLIKERIPALMVVLGLIIYTFLMIIICGIGFSNKYEDDIARLEIENKKKKYDLKEAYNTIEGIKKEHQECEYFIVPTEDGFVIDGRLYEEVEGFEAYE